MDATTIYSIVLIGLLIFGICINFTKPETRKKFRGTNLYIDLFGLAGSIITNNMFMVGVLSFDLIVQVANFVADFKDLEKRLEKLEKK